MERNLRKDKQLGCVGLKMEFYKDKNGKVIEGFLGDSKECEILFILREPNNNGDEPNDFWFKRVLTRKVTNGKRYIRTLGRLYNIINNKKDMSDKVLVENLKRCCYINIHPHFGYSSASAEYKTMLEDFKNKKTEGARNRWNIIDELIENYGCKYVITVEDIFSAIYSKLNTKLYEDVGFVYGNKLFRSCEYKGASIYEFYHPSYPISYEKIRLRGKI